MSVPEPARTPCAAERIYIRQTACYHNAVLDYCSTTATEHCAWNLLLRAIVTRNLYNDLLAIEQFSKIILRFIERRSAIKFVNLLSFIMEEIHASSLVDAMRIDSDKTTTSFVKEAPKIMRYSVRNQGGSTQIRN